MLTPKPDRCLKIMLLIILEPGRNISCPLCRVPITTKPIPNHQVRCLLVFYHIVTNILSFKLKEVITSHVDTLHPTLNKIYSQLLKQAEETFADDERHGTLFNGVFKSPVQAPLYIEQLNPHKSEANHDAGDKEHAPAKEWWQGLSYKELRARDPIAFGKCPRCLSRLYWGVCSEWLCGYGQ